MHLIAAVHYSPLPLQQAQVLCFSWSFGVMKCKMSPFFVWTEINVIYYQEADATVVTTWMERRRGEEEECRALIKQITSLLSVPLLYSY